MRAPPIIASPSPCERLFVQRGGRRVMLHERRRRMYARLQLHMHAVTITQAASSAQLHDSWRMACSNRKVRVVLFCQLLSVARSRRLWFSFAFFFLPPMVAATCVLLLGLSASMFAHASLISAVDRRPCVCAHALVACPARMQSRSCGRADANAIEKRCAISLPACLWQAHEPFS